MSMSNRILFPDMNKFYAPIESVSGGTIAIFTDSNAQMLRNEIKKYLFLLRNIENWLFMKVLVTLEKNYKKLQHASEQKTIELQKQNFESDLNKILKDFLIETAENHNININCQLRNNLISAISNNNLQEVAKDLTAAAREVLSHINQCISIKSPNTEEDKKEIQRLIVIKASSIILDAKEILNKITTFKKRIDDLVRLTAPVELTYIRRVSAEAKVQLETAREKAYQQGKFNYKIHNIHVSSFKSVDETLDKLQKNILDLLTDPQIEFYDFQEKLNVMLKESVECLTTISLDIYSNEKPDIHHFSNEINKMIHWLEKIKTDSSEEKIAARLKESQDLQEAKKMHGQHFHYRMRSLSSPMIVTNTIKISEKIVEEESPNTAKKLTSS